jgi:hypothetical protein
VKFRDFTSQVYAISWNSTNFMKFHEKVHELHESP